MKWTKDVPKEKGWYWIRLPSGAAYVVEVILLPASIRVNAPWGWFIATPQDDYDWAEIPEPTEAA